MADLTGSRILFFTTSPRTPSKMIPEIKILGDNFTGQLWNNASQIKFIEQLMNEGLFVGKGSGDLSFSARDRITRAPKALGFVDLRPTISITEAGRALVLSKRTEEVFLRQMLKFQLPSPYHKASNTEENIFWVRPYLEIMRLVHHFGSLGFDEAMLFGLQLTDYRKFDDIVDKIEDFRNKKQLYKGKYRELYKSTLIHVLGDVYEAEITAEKTDTRQSADESLDKFLRTKRSNMRDYTDACFRYLRATGLFDISQRGKSLSVVRDKIKDIEFIFESVDRDPVYIDNELDYKRVLFDAQIPALYTDNREKLIEQIQEIGVNIPKDVTLSSMAELKDCLADSLEANKVEIINQQVARIKDYKDYDSIMGTFSDINAKTLYDTPLMLEWNTWRAMTMLDGGEIIANLKFDDKGEPMSTAQGNMADIVCNYEDFGLTVEVTMSSGQRQYETEGEPVSRHLAKFKKDTEKNAFCLFIAPKINEACISHFYMLHKTEISYYGGKSVVIPIELSTFEKMLADSHKASYNPSSDQVKALFEFSMESANNSSNEAEWYKSITDRALNWLNA